MNYSEAYQYMESLKQDAGTAQPGRILELCGRLGNLQKKVKYVHAAGVKDAAAAFIASILRCAGYKVGSFLPIKGADWGTQILVGRRRITKAAFEEGVARIREAGDKMAAEGMNRPTAECAEALLAMWYFAKEGCQLAVLENAIVMWNPPMFMAEEAELSEHKDRLACWEEVADFGEVLHIRHGLEGQTFDYKTYKKLEIPLAGKGQIDNALLAIEMVERLRASGLEISERALYQGLKETRWPGAFEILHKKPFFVLDGADCSASAGELTRSIELYFRKKRVIYIMGMLRGSDPEKIIRRTAEYADMIITVTPSHPQAIHAFDLAKEIAAFQPNVTAVDSPEEAVEISMLLAGKEDVIVAFGTPVLQWRLRDILTQGRKKK